MTKKREVKKQSTPTQSSIAAPSVQAQGVHAGGLPLEKKCYHRGAVHLFEVRGLTIYAAQRSALYTGSYDAPKLFLNCTGYAEKAVLDVPDTFAELRKHGSADVHLTIDWDDGAEPDLMPSFWHALPDVCIAQGWKALTVYCLGSHGRTGTALAALLVANCNMDISAAVHVVRKAHCMNAVETTRQVLYLGLVAKWAHENGYLDKATDKPCDVEPSYKLRTLQPMQIAHVTPGSTMRDDDFKFGNF